MNSTTTLPGARQIETVEPKPPEGKKPPVPGKPGKPREARWTFEKDVRLYADPLSAASRDDRSSSWLVSALLCVVMIATFGVWSVHAQIEEVATGTARVIASQREQVIQSLEGGILSEMLVREGAIVNKGDVLLKIDPTRANAAFQEGQSKLLALKAAAARLRAEVADRPEVNFPPDVLAEAELVATERSTFAARRAAMQQAVEGMKQSRTHITKEAEITEPMVTKGLVPEVDLLRLRRQLSELDTNIADRSNRYRADASTELARVEAELSQQSEVMGAKKDQMERTLVRAPLRGTVKNIKVTTTGGVIQPGQDIMEIIPLDDTLLVEAKIRPSEVAFLRPGLTATVKLSAYESQIYGSMKGKVEFISPDTLREDRKPEEDTYYRVVVRTDHAYVEHNGSQLAVLPGMTATVDILTGHRTVANYLLKPVLRLKEAFRER